MPSAIKKMTQGNNLREAIKMAGMKQKEFAAKAHMTEENVSKIVNGHVAISQRNAVLFASLLDVSTDYLLGKSPEMKVEKRDAELMKMIVERLLEVNEMLSELKQKVKEKEDNDVLETK